MKKEKGIYLLDSGKSLPFDAFSTAAFHLEMKRSCF